MISCFWHLSTLGESLFLNLFYDNRIMNSMKCGLEFANSTFFTRDHWVLVAISVVHDVIYYLEPAREGRLENRVLLKKQFDGYGYAMG